MQSKDQIYDSRLDPCKHCGGRAYVKTVEKYPDHARAVCSECGITTPFVPVRGNGGKKSFKPLISLWNATPKQSEACETPGAPAKPVKRASKSAKPATVEEVPSHDPLLRTYRYTCCGYKFTEPLCTPGYKPVEKAYCPNCGEKLES